jgi:hypothetical protein
MEIGKALGGGISLDDNCGEYPLTWRPVSEELQQSLLRSLAKKAGTGVSLTPRLFGVSLLLAGDLDVCLPDMRRHFKAMLTFPDYQGLTEEFEALCRARKLRSFSIRLLNEEGWFDFGMCQTLAGMIGKAKFRPPEATP